MKTGATELFSIDEALFVIVGKTKKTLGPSYKGVQGQMSNIARINYICIKLLKLHLQSKFKIITTVS